MLDWLKDCGWPRIRHRQPPQVAPEVVLTMDGWTKKNLWLQTCAYDRLRSAMSLQHRLTQRFAVPTKTSSRVWTLQWKNCSRTSSHKSPKDAVFSPAQMSAIQDTVSTSINEAMRVFNTHKAQACFLDDLRTPGPQTLNTATPLGLHRP